MRSQTIIRRHGRLGPRLSATAVLAPLILSALAGTANSQLRPQTPGAPSAGTTAANSSEAKIESYPLNAASRPVLTRWQRQVAGRSDLRVAIDERTSQALVFAPPAIHAQIRQQIAQSQAPAANGRAQTAGTRTNAPQAAPVGSPQAGPILVQLQNMAVTDLHARLEKMLGRALPATADASGQWSSFTVEASPGVAVTMSFNAGTRQVRIDGPATQAAAWRSVVEALDAPPSADGNITQLVTTKPTTHERVRRTLEVLQARGSNGRVADSSLVAMLLQQQDAQDPADGQQPPANGQQPAQPAETLEITPGTEQTAIDAARLAEAAGAILGPVDVEFVEGLDVIVLRGSERDVQRVMEIIRQIEELSAVTVPAIQIYNLQNVDSMQMAVLLNRLYAQVLGPRIGTVSITPLGKPNALLLIGRTENVQMAIRLIQQLDQPATPTSQFQVFRLRNATAAEAKTLIDAFLRQDEEGEPQQD
ncbi:MAG TPA: secretin N-terminal domain-containing protein, partial [Lacipirellulaceae bacterium]